MSLEVFYLKDIRNALLSAEHASAATQHAVFRDDPLAKAYQDDYRAALTTLALAFGLLQP